MESTVLCYLFRENQCLMLLRNKREQDLNQGKWIGVGGHIEENETIEEALVREVFEETGYHLKDYTKRGIIYFINDDYEEMMHLYTSDSFTGNLKECDEGTLEYIPISEILNLNLWDGDRVFLEKMLKTKDYFEMKLYYKENQFIRSELL